MQQVQQQCQGRAGGLSTSSFLMWTAPSRAGSRQTWLSLVGFGWACLGMGLEVEQSQESILCPCTAGIDFATVVDIEPPLVVVPGALRILADKMTSCKVLRTDAG